MTRRAMDPEAPQFMTLTQHLTSAERQIALLPLRRAFYVGAAALLCVAATFGALAVAQRHSAAWVWHGREVGRVARQALAMAVDRETGVRGFLLSGDETSLEPEIEARRALPPKLDTLIALTADNPAQQARARAARVALDRWTREVAERADHGGGDAERRRARHDLAGKAQFDAVRGAFGAFLAAEDALYDARVRRERAVELVALGAGLIELVLLLCVFAWLRRRVLHQAADLLDQQEMLEEQAIELEAQTAELEMQTAELGEQTRQSEALAAELGDQRRFLRHIIDTIPSFVFVKDRMGRFTLVNRSVADAYGTVIDDMLGKTDADFNWNAAEVEAIRRDELAVMDSRSSQEIPEEMITDASGAIRWMQTVKRPLSADGAAVDHLLVVSTEITDRKRAEGELRESEERLRQAQKMEAVGRLAGGVAHDFNNVLTVIRSYSEFLLEDLEHGDPRRDDVGEINKAAARAAALTRQLLAFSRQQVLQPRALDLNATVRDLAPMLGRLIGAHVHFETRLAPSLGVVRADAGQIEQILLNLVVNARDAMPDGGALAVATANVDLTEDAAYQHAGAAPGAYVMLAVSDTGCGMPRETQARIFEPFFTTKEQGQGTGLGLATVYGIVKQSGGTIWVYSEPGHGSTFKIYLPRVAAEADVPDEGVSGFAPVGGPETVLLVEDDPGVRAAARRTLARAGYTLLEAANGAEALALCAETTSSIDLVVTDLMMPEMGGRELAARLRSQRPDIRLLYMSGFTRDAVLRKSVFEPGAAFIEKPFTPDDLARKVRDVLERAIRESQPA